MTFTKITAIMIKVVSPWLAIFYLSRVFKQMHKLSRLVTRAKLSILPQGSKVEFHVTLQEKERDKQKQKAKIQRAVIQPSIPSTIFDINIWYKYLI